MAEGRAQVDCDSQEYKNCSSMRHTQRLAGFARLELGLSPKFQSGISEWRPHSRRYDFDAGVLRRHGTLSWLGLRDQKPPRGCHPYNNPLAAGKNLAQSPSDSPRLAIHHFVWPSLASSRLSQK